MKHTPFYTLINTLLVSVLLMVGSSAYANTSDVPERYEVEVFVFQSFARSAWLEEFWPESIESVDIENSVSPFTQNLPPMNIVTSNVVLTDTLERLKRAGYEVLLHQAWEQVPLSRKSNQSVRLEVATTNTTLTGTVKFAKGRYEHILLDLDFERVIPQSVIPEFAAKLGYDDITLLPATWNFKLKEHRKVKDKELHYFDHPLFGALVQIRKIETPKTLP